MHTLWLVRDRAPGVQPTHCQIRDFSEIDLRTFLTDSGIRWSLQILFAVHCAEIAPSHWRSRIRNSCQRTAGAAPGEQREFRE
jgi:hypothetical protein